jgi:hypothetical protein
MLFNITVQVRFTGDLSSLEEQLDRVMEELVGIGVVDPSIGAALPDGNIEISLSAEGPTLEAALQRAFADIRTAIHAAEGATPNWPEVTGQGVTAQLVDA